MTANEAELIAMIRESDDHSAALMTAVEVILAYLMQGESCREPSFDPPAALT